MSLNAQTGLATMLALVDSLPDQFADSLNLHGLESISSGGIRPRRIVLCAMGGSAIGGDLIQGLLTHQGVSLEVWRDYGLPHWVSPDDLVIAASYSGNTEECLSAVAEARRRGVAVLAICSGGTLAELLLPGENMVTMPAGLPPRAALGHSFGALLGVMDRLNLIDNLKADLDEAVALLRRKPTCGRLSAEKLASDLKGRIPVLYVGDSLLAGVAVRWKGQLNENAKTPALMALFPELNHNDIVGWGLSESWQDRFVLIMLESGLEQGNLQRRMALTRQLLESEFASVHILKAEGESALAKILSLVQYGDYVSCHLAGLRGVDPMPVERIDRLKSGLSDPEASSLIKE